MWYYYIRINIVQGEFRMKNKVSGFTLIELMIVVAIIGVLAAVAIPKFSDMIEKSREGATKGNISAIQASVRLYYSNTNGDYPDSITADEYKKYVETIPPVRVTHPHGGTRLSGKSNQVELLEDPPGKGKGHAYGTQKFKNNTDGWRYYPVLGLIWVNNAQKDTQGADYTFYGYK